MIFLQKPRLEASGALLPSAGRYTTRPACPLRIGPPGPQAMPANQKASHPVSRPIYRPRHHSAGPHLPQSLRERSLAISSC